MTAPIFFIVNPAAGDGRGLATWRATEKEAKRRGLAFEYEMSRAPLTAISFVRQALRVLFLVGVVVAIDTFLTNPSSAAVATRRSMKSGIGWVRERGERRGLNAGPVDEWTTTHKTVLRIKTVTLIALIFVF